METIQLVAMDGVETMWLRFMGTGVKINITKDQAKQLAADLLYAATDTEVTLAELAGA
jgi:hypothetical protein